ncbi:histidine--tRNA ligase [Kandleria vitulina DSM 20405]|jgi:histidyl-tRNA synthetase|uniref:Histidine--tRNA ligase n=1 Tax=Kandleria vitulina DSM 20405 TaxID=1410657 RepID=A0A0R2HFT6_9FIRM|nr:histidine--tRNA ligase [Kandleria vitulina]KRN51310.1 histidine--tRNA ligase [Kandleria vitulina DSM 20405]MEE0988886.1 histidine--tRNA ligase [Kandleria vitulina]SDL58165.1 histidyl-tRNA synthetase [Kandleria vitulina]SEJ05455.1 histidyl-tRNA synthetase [Kandleria vitulina]
MKYSAPRGTVDILPDASGKWEKLERILRTIASNYHVKEMRTPIFEHTELFNRAVGDTTDVVTKEMYTFEDKKGRSITLRPEGTAGIARAYVENKMYALPEKLTKVFYMGPMFRYERPQSGRQRQFHQFGVEMLGVESPYVDVECMMMAITVVKALGLENVTLHINSLGDEESRDAYRKALQDHFRPVLSDLCEDCNARFEKNPLRILDCKVDAKHEAMKTAPKTIDYLSESAKAHFDKVCALLDDLEVDYVIDTNLVRGLDYYSHTVFEIISDDPKLGAGATVGGGGRYNGLVEEIGGPATPGVGFAFGLERLMIALNDNEDDDEGIDAYIMPLGEEARDLGMQISAVLRANGFSVDMDYAGRGFKGQFKSADRFKATYSLLLGEDEVKGEYVNIRDNKTKEQEQVPFEDIVSYLEKGLGL